MTRWWEPGPMRDNPRSGGEFTAVDTRDPHATPVSISPLQWRSSFDEGFRRRHPFLGWRNALGARDIDQRGGGDQMGFGVGQGLSSLWQNLHGNDWKSLTTNSALGAAGGFGLMTLLSRLRENNNGESIGFLPKVLAALAGAGGGAALTYDMRSPSKQAAADDVAWGPAADRIHRDMILRKTLADRQVPESAKAGIIRAMGRLSDQEIRSLQRAVATVGGAAVGVFVMRWLVGRGLLSLTAGATLGAFAGSRLFRSNRNAFGREDINDYR